MKYSIDQHSEYIESLASAMGGQEQFAEFTERVTKAASGTRARKSDPQNLVLNNPEVIAKELADDFAEDIPERFDTVQALVAILWETRPKVTGKKP